MSGPVQMPQQPTPPVLIHSIHHSVDPLQRQAHALLGQLRREVSLALAGRGQARQHELPEHPLGPPLILRPESSQTEIVADLAEDFVKARLQVLFSLELQSIGNGEGPEQPVVKVLISPAVVLSAS